MTITGGPETGESTVVKLVKQIVNQAMGNDRSVLWMVNKGTAVFVISRDKCHSILGLPVNLPFNLLSGWRLRQLQENLRLIRVIIIDEVSMLEKKIVFYWQNT